MDRNRKSKPEKSSSYSRDPRPEEVEPEISGLQDDFDEEMDQDSPETLRPPHPLDLTIPRGKRTPVVLCAESMPNIHKEGSGQVDVDVPSEAGSSQAPLIQSDVLRRNKSESWKKDQSEQAHVNGAPAALKEPAKSTNDDFDEEKDQDNPETLRSPHLLDLTIPRGQRTPNVRRAASRLKIFGRSPLDVPITRGERTPIVRRAATMPNIHKEGSGQVDVDVPSEAGSSKVLRRSKSESSGASAENEVETLKEKCEHYTQKLNNLQERITECKLYKKSLSRDLEAVLRGDPEAIARLLEQRKEQLQVAKPSTSNARNDLIEGRESESSKKDRGTVLLDTSRDQSDGTGAASEDPEEPTDDISAANEALEEPAEPDKPESSSLPIKKRPFFQDPPPPPPV